MSGPPRDQQPVTEKFRNFVNTKYVESEYDQEQTEKIMESFNQFANEMVERTFGALVVPKTPTNPYQFNANLGEAMRNLKTAGQQWCEAYRAVCCDVDKQAKRVDPIVVTTTKRKLESMES